MKGQVCVVTGASRGIGRGIALQLCQAGATVYITGRHLDTLQATAQEVSEGPTSQTLPDPKPVSTRVGCRSAINTRALQNLRESGVKRQAHVDKKNKILKKEREKKKRKNPKHRNKL